MPDVLPTASESTQRPSPTKRGGFASREDVYRALHSDSIPEWRREELKTLAAMYYGEAPARRRDAEEGLKRDPEQRRSYAGQPARYFRDVFGYRMTPQQEAVLEDIETHDKVLVPSGTNLGKSFLAACYAIYRFDSVSAVLDDLGAQQGARILLPGPKHAVVFHTIYNKIMKHALVAEARGFLMPGRRSERGVHWKVPGFPDWEMEAFSPAHRVGQSVTHTASGRHHQNQLAVMEEAAGISEELFAATEGMCSSDGNKILALFNPTEASGAAFTRTSSSRYHVIHFSAFDHPNVRGRQIVVPGAIAYREVDDKVRDQCKDRGPFPKIVPDPVHRDFVYALPEKGEQERGKRSDGELGMEGSPLRVFRPTPLFEGQVLGQYPSTSDKRLFSLASIQEAMNRWKASPDPEDPPDVVGCDAARMGADDFCAAPRWGPGGETLVRGYLEAREEGADQLREFCRTHGSRIGEIRILSKGDGPHTAEELVALWPNSPFNIDAGGGESTVDHLAFTGFDAMGVSFGASAPDPLPGMPWCENLRTFMYVVASRVLSWGLIDIPDDAKLKEELLAHEIVKTKYRVVLDYDEQGRPGKTKRPSVLLIDKDEIKKRLGRSPDKADAFVLALLDTFIRQVAAPFFTPSAPPSAMFG